MPDEHRVEGSRDPLLGQLAGPFLLIAPLGQGAFGQVYRGVRLPLSSERIEVAIKVMRPAHPSVAAQATAKFAIEADALSILSHPNLVRCIDSSLTGPLPFIAMELVPRALTLEELIEMEHEAGGAFFDVPEKRRFVEQILDALDAAHGAGIIHRDLKPANILVETMSDGGRRIRLVDFGLAKFFEDDPDTQLAIGSPAFMAPEQFTRTNLGPWTDLYAVAVVAMELLLGRSPFEHMSVGEITTLKMGRSDRLDEAAFASCSAAARRFFRRALARDPRARFANAAAFKAAFRRLGDDLDSGRTMIVASAQQASGRDLRFALAQTCVVSVGEADGAATTPECAPLVPSEVRAPERAAATTQPFEWPKPQARQRDYAVELLTWVSAFLFLIAFVALIVR